MTEAKDILVIGLGNPDCGDDGLGPLVARKLGEGDCAGARVIARSGDALGLIEDWADSETVLLVDAAAAISRPGSIHRIDLATEGLPRDLSLSSTHAFSMADAVGLARTLDMLPPHIIVYAVEGISFAPGAPMSVEVVAAADEVACRVMRELHCLSEVEPCTKPAS
jgi:hydrogenase maturation protease